MVPAAHSFESQLPRQFLPGPCRLHVARVSSQKTGGPLWPVSTPAVWALGRVLPVCGRSTRRGLSWARGQPGRACAACSRGRSCLQSSPNRVAVPVSGEETESHSGRCRHGTGRSAWVRPAGTSACSFGQVSLAAHSGQGEGAGTRTLWEKGQGEGRVAGRSPWGPPGGRGQKHPCHCGACGAGAGLLMTGLGVHSWV